ncbi:hypothetical protein [Sphingobium subterraneum]|uniref:Flippase-like domain-containing protein n=1 Tax=Sphingobium subterraneum TaxID=627688 RepID=A0A841J8Z3_9SPHN|nr:hypothetical protein [Sphingobium subterraneum]MBB6124631.1 hypothetical protein [Sphingobium subterraneum]
MDESIAAIAPLIDPAPLLSDERRWTRIAGPLVSFLILLSVVYQLKSLNVAELEAIFPRHPGFWLLFSAYYLMSPFSEWIIFRRLWILPVGGFAALLRKLISNEILLGYLGEVYFYAWARRHAYVVAAPFGAIKDVTILSALTGNIATLILFLLAAPLLGSLPLGVSSHTFVLSAGCVLATSFLLMVLRKSLFTLPRDALCFIGAVHMARILACALLAALMWHILLPTMALSWLLVLSAMRQLLSRLPLLPNKDLVFAGLATFVVGRDTEIVAAMALMASLILAAHLVVGALLASSELLQERSA